MSLNPLYIPLYQLQQYFVDKDTGAPLAGGKVYFYSDVNRTVAKNVYELQGNSANYTFSPLPNPVILSAVGTPVDVNGNDIVIYAYPFDANGNSELYYVVVQNYLGVPQFTRQAVPGVSGGGVPSESLGLINLIPNGQFLSHTNLPNVDNELVGGSNPIAQGGFSVELDAGAASDNTWKFIVQPPTENPTQSPRYIGQFTCITPVGSENNKSIRIKWDDVNKFSTATTNGYTFAFWSNTLSAIPVSINVVKYFGTNGSPSTSVTQESTTLPANPEFLGNQFQIDFGTNTGYNVDLVNNNDWVAIDISLPRNIAFTLQVTDFVLLPGNVNLEGFPVQTNADMLTRGVMGWVDVPKPDGYDLYCPPVLTREGMVWDRSGIGKIEASAGTPLSPNNPLNLWNDMPCDGASYLASDYSAIGVPYARLRDFLVTGSIAGYPIYGTGLDFSTAWLDNSGADALYLTVNSAGTPIAGATDSIPAPTGFTFNTAVTYGSTKTGATAVYTISEWAGSAYFYVLRPTTTTTALAQSAGLGFTLNLFDPYVSLVAEQNLFGFACGTVAASAMTPTAGVAPYLTFTTGAVAFILYFLVDGSGWTTPDVAATTKIILEIESTCTAIQVAQLTSYALRSLQISYIKTIASPPVGSYFIYQANPAALRNIAVWYSYNASDTPPVYAGELIRVNLPASPTAAIVANLTYNAINGYQFAAPDLQGMFLRGVDPNGNWDTDRTYRINQGLGYGGYVGSYELQQVIEHNHKLTMNTSGPSSSAQYGLGNATPFTSTTFIGQTGGSETRPINSYVNWIIKY